MNTQFRIPSFGDEMFDLSDISGTSEGINNSNYIYQQHLRQQELITSPQGLQSKRFPDMNNSACSYYSVNDESYVSSTTGINTNDQNMAMAQNVNVSNPTGLIQSSAQPTIKVNVDDQHGSTSSDVNAVNAVMTEPAKPLSAYALFFRDTVSAIKHQNPDCSFPELSRIVASMWDVLDPIHKNVYNKRNELARNEYMKQMKIYRQHQLEQQQQQQQQQQQVAEQMANQQHMVHNDINTTHMQQSSGNFNAYEHHNNNGNSGLQTQQQQQSLIQNQQLIQQQQQPNISSGNTAMQTQYQQQPAENFNLCNNINNNNSAATLPALSSSIPTALDKQYSLEMDSVQKCTREDCNKRAIINPDWEDEYCSNECVIIHCRNVFNVWVQSNLEAKKLQQH